MKPQQIKPPEGWKTVPGILWDSYTRKNWIVWHCGGSNPWASAVQVKDSRAYIQHQYHGTPSDAFMRARGQST